MLNIGPPELLLVLVIALIIVGPKKLPELARAIGRGLSEFRKVQDEVKDMVKLDLSVDPVTTPTTSSPTPHRTPRPARAAITSGDEPDIAAEVPDVDTESESDAVDTESDAVDAESDRGDTESVVGEAGDAAQPDPAAPEE